MRRASATELRMRPTRRRRIELVTVLGGLTVVAASLVQASAAYAANPACQWYVTQSARQQQENTQRACGLRGPEWTADTKVHAAYCESTPADDTKAAVQRRQKALDDCARAAAAKK